MATNKYTKSYQISRAKKLAKAYPDKTFYVIHSNHIPGFLEYHVNDHIPTSLKNCTIITKINGLLVR